MSGKYGPDDHSYVDVIRDQYGRTHITLDDSVMDQLATLLWDVLVDESEHHADLTLRKLANGLAVAQDEMHETY